MESRREALAATDSKGKRGRPAAELGLLYKLPLRAPHIPGVSLRAANAMGQCA